MTSRVELDPFARWPKSLVENAGHDLTFLQKLAGNLHSLLCSSKSRHMRGFDSVTNHSNLRTEDYVRILSSFPPKTLEKLDHVRDWSDITEEFVEEVFRECLEVYAEYSSVRVSLYLKIICLMKEEWIELLDNLNELSGVDSHVLAFAKKVRENLKTLGKYDYSVAFYVGETIQIFQARVNKNYPTEFLSPFPATHVFKFCRVKDGTPKDCDGIVHGHMVRK